MTMTMPGLIEFDRGFLRDLGGFLTEDGSSVKLRTVFLAADLDRITEPAIAHLGCRTVLDLRNPTGAEPAGAEATRAAFEALASPKTVPAVLHCSPGENRTGALAALLLAALGVGDERIAARSAELLTSPPGAVRDFLGGLRSRHGGVRLYLADIGIYRETVESLRDNLLQCRGEPAGST